MLCWITVDPEQLITSVISTLYMRKNVYQILEIHEGITNSLQTWDADGLRYWYEQAKDCCANIPDTLLQFVKVSKDQI